VNATLLDPPIETPETSVSCEDCPAVQRLERALERLWAEFRCEVGYWKSRHADAVKRIEQLKEELDQSRAQTRALQDKLFGCKSEKSAQSNRSHDLFDPEEEFVSLPEESLVCPMCGKLAAMMSDSVASEVLEVDRYAGYKAMAQVKSGQIVLAFCWAHVRRDFVGVGKSWSELTPWALSWLRRIRQVYQVNRERLRHRLGSAKFPEQDALLRGAVEDSRIPMDNNASERAGRGPAVARKNFYGSGSLWSGRLAAAMFSLLATLAHWNINPRRWLRWYLESCATVGGRAPDDIQPFLPWNLTAERRAALAMRTTPPAANTS